MKVVIDLSKEDLRIICERTKKEIWEEYGGVDQRLMEAVQNGKIISELKGEKKYETEVITRGNCMMCGKELTEGLFFCKECEEKANSRK